MEPYFEWLSDDGKPIKRKEVIKRAVQALEVKAHDQGWDQPLVLVAATISSMPEMPETAAMTFHDVWIPGSVIESPGQNFLPFAKLVTQSTFKGEAAIGQDFAALLIRASVGSPDQELEAPRIWLSNLVEGTGVPIGWMVILERWGIQDSVYQPYMEHLGDEELRDMPGVDEVRQVIYVDKDRFALTVSRVRGREPGEVQEVQLKQEDLDDILRGLALLTLSGLAMGAELDMGLPDLD